MDIWRYVKQHLSMRFVIEQFDYSATVVTCHKRNTQYSFTQLNIYETRATCSPSRTL